jgi:hypothetical protein
MHATSIAASDVADRLELEQLVARVGQCLDDGRYDDLRTIYTDDAVADTPGGRAEGIDAVVAQARRSHERFAAVHHLITGTTAEVDGDHAHVRAEYVAVFRQDAAAPMLAQGASYRFTARRTTAAWRLASVTSLPRWRWGDLPAP